MIVASPAWKAHATVPLDSSGSSAASSPMLQLPKPSPTSALRSIAAAGVTWRACWHTVRALGRRPNGFGPVDGLSPQPPRKPTPMSTAAHAAAAPGGRPRGRELRKIIGASLIGTSLEWYDFFLYGTAAALVFNKLLFPSFDPLVGTLLSFATFAVGFGARPVGGVVFGHYGVRVGRRRILVFTLVIMGGATFLIGCLPTYDAIGAAAPILLVALRFIQGLGLGGEWGGAVLMVAEHGDERRRGLHSSWPQVGVPAGNLLSAGVLALLAAALSEDAFSSWRWRLPFLLSAVLIVVGLWIRLTVEESPLFRELERSGQTEDAPMAKVIRCYPRQLAIAVCARLGVDVAFYTF